MNKSTQSFTYSSLLLLLSIGIFALALSTPKPYRFGTLGITAVVAGIAASIAHRGIIPAQLEQGDKAAELACAEAERENVLEEIQESDDMDRELKYHQRKLEIEAEALRRTLPDRLEIQRIENMLYPPPVLINQMQAPGQMPPHGPIPLPSLPGPPGQTVYFDWNELANADVHPVLMIIAKQGAGKSLLIKYLAKHPLQGAKLTIADIFARVGDWPGSVIHTDYSAIAQFMRDGINILERRIPQYQQGKSDFEPHLWVFEEFPDAVKSIATKDKRAKQDADLFMDKCSTIARKLRCRLCLVSQKLSAKGAGAAAEIRDDATIIFPGHSGVNKAMNDDQILKLGTRANAKLREQLQAALQHVPHPALIYRDGTWYPAIIPALDQQGNPAIAPPPNPSPTSQPPTDRQSLEDLYKRSDDDFQGCDR
jgi:hypothetical protein